MKSQSFFFGKNKNNNLNNFNKSLKILNSLKYWLYFYGPSIMVYPFVDRHLFLIQNV